MNDRSTLSSRTAMKRRGAVDHLVHPTLGGQTLRTIGRSPVVAALLLARLLMPGDALAQPATATPATVSKTPEAKAPAAKAPEAKAPEAKAPEAKAPEAKAPEAKAQAPASSQGGSTPTSEAAPQPPANPDGAEAAPPVAAGAPADAATAPSPSDTESAPPPAATPTPTDPETPPSAPGVPASYPVKVVSPIAGLQLQLHRIRLGDIEHSPTEDYEAFVDACASPCEATIEAGAYQLAVRTPSGERARATTGLLLEGPATVSADVVSNEQIRREGWYWVLIGSTVGAIAAGVGLAQNCDDNACAKQASLGIWGGITAMSVSWVIGMPKIRTEDEVKITISPGVTGTTGRDIGSYQHSAGAF